jgi:hypothetical protein
VTVTVTVTYTIKLELQNVLLQMSLFYLFIFLPVKFSSEGYEEWLAQRQRNVLLYASRKYSLCK